MQTTESNENRPDGIAFETPAATLRRAATHLRDLATRATTVLTRRDVEWTDLTVADAECGSLSSPMVWSQYSAAMHPGVGQLLADLLDDTADGIEQDRRSYAETSSEEYAVKIAQQILGEVTR